MVTGLISVLIVLLLCLVYAGYNFRTVELMDERSQETTDAARPIQEDAMIFLWKGG